MRKIPPHFEAEPQNKVSPKRATGIGNIMVADARLHLYLKELVCDLLRIDYQMGRLAIRQVKNSEVFNFALALMDMWDIKSAGVTALLKKIKKC